VDGAHSFHAEGLELDRPQGSHARASEHVDALLHGPHDLLVPHGGNALEVAVDDADGLGPLERDAVDIPLRDGRQIHGVQELTRLRCGKGGAREDIDAHACPPMRVRAREPYWQFGTTPLASRPGMITRATGNPNSGLVRSTTTTRSTPAAVSRFSSQATSWSRLSPSNVGASWKSRWAVSAARRCRSPARGSGDPARSYIVRKRSSRDPEMVAVRLWAASVRARRSATSGAGWQPEPPAENRSKGPLLSRSTMVHEKQASPTSVVSSQTPTAIPARSYFSSTSRQPGSSTVSRSIRRASCCDGLSKE